MSHTGEPLELRALIDELRAGGSPGKEKMLALLDGLMGVSGAQPKAPDAEELREARSYLYASARRTQRAVFGVGVFKRGLIEIGNYCRNDCYYCGIRRGNGNAVRYRLTEDEISACCREGYDLGFRTFVLQGGEDPFFSVSRIERIVRRIKESHPDCAVTLSLGEADRDAYRRWRKAGADRYLLRHETADEAHYRSLHPGTLSPEHRKRCLYALKELGYQVGTGFMVGSPGQTTEHLVSDLAFIRELEPHMVGIGPFLPHRDTIYRAHPAGSVELTLILIAVIRLMSPGVLLPATTALGSAAEDGRERGILAGANVVMPNLTPVPYRAHYALYDGKICTGEEAAQCGGCLSRRMRGIGYELLVGKGDYTA